MNKDIQTKKKKKKTKKKKKKKKSQTTENSDTYDDIWDNTIPLTEPTLNNSPGKQYPTRNF